MHIMEGLPVTEAHMSDMSDTSALLQPMPLPTETQCEHSIGITHHAAQLMADQLAEVIQWRRRHPENHMVLDSATGQVSRLATSLARLQLAHAVGAATLWRIRGGGADPAEVRRVGAAPAEEVFLEK